MGEKLCNNTLYLKDLDNLVWRDLCDFIKKENNLTLGNFQ